MAPRRRADRGDPRGVEAIFVCMLREEAQGVEAIRHRLHHRVLAPVGEPVFDAGAGDASSVQLADDADDVSAGHAILIAGAPAAAVYIDHQRRSLELLLQGQEKHQVELRVADLLEHDIVDHLQVSGNLCGAPCLFPDRTRCLLGCGLGHDAIAHRGGQHRGEDEHDTGISQEPVHHHAPGHMSRRSRASLHVAHRRTVGPIIQLVVPRCIPRTRVLQFSTTRARRSGRSQPCRRIRSGFRHPLIQRIFFSIPLHVGASPSNHG